MAFGSGVSRQFYYGSHCQPPSARPGQLSSLLLHARTWYPEALVSICSTWVSHMQGGIWSWATANRGQTVQDAAQRGWSGEWDLEQ